MLKCVDLTIYTKLVLERAHVTRFWWPRYWLSHPPLDMPTTNQPLQHAARFLNSHKFGFYSFVSIIAVVGVITNALKNYSNFYSVTIFLSKSSRSILVTFHLLPIASPSDSSQRHWQILLFFSLFCVAILCNESSSARFDRMKLRYDVVIYIHAIHLS